MSNDAYWPDGLDLIRIEELRNGQLGYAIPWSLFSDDSGVIWFHTGYPFRKHPYGTSTMQITRNDNEIVVNKDTVGMDYPYPNHGRQPRLPVTLLSQEDFKKHLRWWRRIFY